MGSELTLGVFLNVLPVRLSADTQDWHAAAAAAFAADRALLPHRRYPFRQLHSRVGSFPFGMVFDYLKFHPWVELADAGVDVESRLVKDETSIPLMIEAVDSPLVTALDWSVVVDGAYFPGLPASRLIEKLLALTRSLSESSSLGELS
jgi:hypothetical protein